MGWTQPLLTVAGGQIVISTSRNEDGGKGSKMKVEVFGIDLAKDVFAAHGVEARGRGLMHKRVARRQLFGLLAKFEPCLVGWKPALRGTVRRCQ